MIKFNVGDRVQMSRSGVIEDVDIEDDELPYRVLFDGAACSIWCSKTGLLPEELT